MTTLFKKIWLFDKKSKVQDKHVCTKDFLEKSNHWVKASLAYTTNVKQKLKITLETLIKHSEVWTSLLTW